jgi:methionyl-tRNA formyltransferase
MTPWPGAFTASRGKVLKVHATRVVDVQAGNHEPGTVVFADKTRVVVACAERGVELVRVQLEGKKPISGPDWFVGRGVAEGDRLG